MRIQWVWAATAAIALLCGCTGQANPAPGGTSSVVPAQASYHGQLKVKDGCIYAEKEGIRFGVVFEDGAKLNSDETKVDLPNGESVALGEPVTLTGGYLPNGPEGCHFDQFFHVNPAS